MDKLIDIKLVDSQLEDFKETACQIANEIGLEVVLAVLKGGSQELQRLLMSIFCTGAIVGILSINNPEAWAEIKKEFEGALEAYKQAIVALGTDDLAG